MGREDLSFVAGVLVASLVWMFIMIFANANQRTDAELRTECSVRAEFAKTLADSVAFSAKIRGCPNTLFFQEKSR